MTFSHTHNFVWGALIICAMAAGRARGGEFHAAEHATCSDCHAAHASKQGEIWTPTERLLKNSAGQVPLCMSCHDVANPLAPDVVAPGTGDNPSDSVSTPYSSKYGSGAGFFQGDYLAAANPCGHDLWPGLSGMAPLSNSFSKPGGLVCSDCHDPHGTPNYRNLVADPNPNHPGSFNIILGTHVKEDTPVDAQNPNASVAYNTSNVSFFEANNIGAWCADCHDVLAQNAAGSSPAHFKSHPSDVSIGTVGAHTDVANWQSAGSGFGADVGDSVPGIPRVRYGSQSGSNTATGSGDTVFCLSCHKAHGSKYEYGLVWPYRQSGPDALSGCQQCHSSGYYSQTAHGSQTTGVQRDPLLPRGSCAQCHAAHGQDQQDFGLWTFNDNNLCFTCHAQGLRSYFGQTFYSSCGHSTSASSYNGRPVGRCVQCHNPHGAGDSGGMNAHLLYDLEEEVCFSCHGNGFRPPNALDIQTLVNKPYSHAVTAFRGKHDDTAENTSLTVNPNPLLSGWARHVECADCHNPHYGRNGHRPARSSNIGTILLGSWGVRPVYPGTAWTAPTSYVVERFADTATEYEYYLCLKCHSNWAWGASAPYTKDGVLQTNAAVEFNPANPAYHNVTGQAASAVPTDDFVFGTASPPAYINSWTPNSAMACTDCHAGDPAYGSTLGPHGSNYSNILKKRFKAQAGATDNTGMSGTQSDLCFDCHDWQTYGEDGNGSATNFRKENDNLHRKSDHARAGCFQCHSAVPHGFKRKHMIVYVTDGSPYYRSDPINYGAEKGGIQSYAPSENGNYSENNCKAGCHEEHQRSNPVNPLP